jgi:ribose transport system ATP-binding protein
MDHLLKIENLSKSYGRNPVLSGLSLELAPGRILGLVGENGAGKSTLVKCVIGAVEPDGGTIARTGGVAAIHQEFNLANHLTAAENIFLGREITRRGLLDRGRMRTETRRLLAKLGKSIDPDAVVGNLSIAEKQSIEIAKALAADCRVLIMDEPSTLLNRVETAALFGVMREFTAAGGAILYISHRLAEVKEICDDIAVLRDGVLIGRDPADTLDVFEIARRMVGRELAAMFPPKRLSIDGAIALRVSGLRAGREVHGVSFALRRGEILGLAGLESAGRTELAEMIGGLRRADGGTIERDRKTIALRHPDDALRHGIGYLADDRKERGLLLDFSIAENVTLANLDACCRAGLLDFRKAAAKAAGYIETFRIAPPDPAARVGELSGGNQQKVAIAKSLDRAPAVFILNEPTRGVDIAARHDIYEFIHRLAAAGIGCLIISSDLEELIGMCARILVMRDGTIAGELASDDITEAEIMYLATGAKPPGRRTMDRTTGDQSPL